MKNTESSILRGGSSAERASSNVSPSGPCAAHVLCRLASPGRSPDADLPSCLPVMTPRYSATQLRWNPGGRKGSSAPAQRGGSTMKSALPPSTGSEGDDSAQKIDGAGWSTVAVPSATKSYMLNLAGT